MHARILLALSAAVCLVATLPAADDKGDLKKMEGVWVMVSGERGGQPAPDQLVNNLKMTIKGDQLSVETGDRSKKGTLSMDATKTPKEMQIKPSEENEKPLLGIYQLDGDTFKMCIGEPGDERPTEFKTGPDTKRAMIMVFKRQK